MKYNIDDALNDLYCLERASAEQGEMAAFGRLETWLLAQDGDAGDNGKPLGKPLVGEVKRSCDGCFYHYPPLDRCAHPKMPNKDEPKSHPTHCELRAAGFAEQMAAEVAHG